MNKFLLLLSLATVALASTDIDYVFSKGPYETFSKRLNKDEWIGLDYNLFVYGPEAKGDFPVIYFSSSLAGNIPTDYYDTIMTHLASHGYVVLAPFKLNWPGFQYHAEWLQALHLWCQENVLLILREFGLAKEMTIDHDTEFVMGHSVGGHVMCEYLKAGCQNVKGLILLSPVDGVDEVGLIPQFCVVKGEKLNFDIPTLIIPGGLDSLPGVTPDAASAAAAKGRTSPCAPEHLSNRRFFDAMNGLTWMVNATEFGHGDLLEPDAVEFIDDLKYCAFNPRGDPNAVYRKFLAGEIVSFAKGIMGECELLRNLEDPDVVVGVKTIMEKQTGAYDDCDGAEHCSWVPLS